MFDFEAAARLKAWNDLSQIIQECEGCEDLRVWSNLADIILGCEAPAETKITVLQVCHVLSDFGRVFWTRYIGLPSWKLANRRYHLTPRCSVASTSLTLDPLSLCPRSTLKYGPCRASSQPGYLHCTPEHSSRPGKRAR